MRALATGVILLGVIESGQVTADDIIPQHGLWNVVGEFGSGLQIEVQDSVLGATIYTYDETGTMTWSQAVGTVEDGVFEAPLVEFTGGTCIECPQYEPPEVSDESRTLRLEFFGSTQGWLSIDDSDPKPIRALVFWSPSAQPLALVDDWGQAFVPAMRGIWVFTSPDPENPFMIRVVFRGTVIIDPPGSPEGDIAVTAVGEHSLLCISGDDTIKVPACVLRAFDPEDNSITPILSFHISDLGIDRVYAYEGPPVSAGSPSIRGDKPVIGVRITEPGNPGCPPFCPP